MQGSSGQGNQNGQQKQGGLSWTQSPGSSTNNTQANSAKPISQVQSPLMPKAQASTNNTSSATKNNSSGNSQLSKKAEGRERSAGRTAAVFISGIVVGLIIGWGWFSLGRDDGKVATNDEGTPVTSSSSENVTSPSTTTGSTNTSGSTNTGSAASGSASSGSVTIASSQAAGTQVAVSSVAVSVPTWVVVFDNVGGKPGNALGAQMFFSGDKAGVIDLLRTTVAGKSYFVGQYIDNGDHKFSKQTDTQVKNVAGAPLLVEFVAR